MTGEVAEVEHPIPGRGVDGRVEVEGVLGRHVGQVLGEDPGRLVLVEGEGSVSALGRNGRGFAGTTGEALLAGTARSAAATRAAAVDSAPTAGAPV